MEKSITYFVNGEIYETFEHKLTVKEVLTKAEFVPVEEYKLIRDNGNKPLADYNEAIPLHSNMKFTALFMGTTPTS